MGPPGYRVWLRRREGDRASDADREPPAAGRSVGGNMRAAPRGRASRAPADGPHLAATAPSADEQIPAIGLGPETPTPGGISSLSRTSPVEDRLAANRSRLLPRCRATALRRPR